MMIKINVILKLFFFSALYILTLQNNALGKEYSFSDSDNELTIKYIISLPASHKITIYNKKNKSMYQKTFNGDYGIPKTTFFDINNDGFYDLIIRLITEGKYSLILLMNVKNNVYIDALFDSLEVNYIFDYDFFNRDIYSGGKKTAKEFYLKDINQDGRKELIFDHLYINRTLIKNASFQLSKNGYRLKLISPK